LLHPLQSFDDFIKTLVDLREMLVVGSRRLVIRHHAGNVFKAPLQPCDRFRLRHALFHRGQARIQTALLARQHFKIVQPTGDEFHAVVDALDEPLDVNLLDIAPDFAQFRPQRFHLNLRLALKKLFDAFGDVGNPVFQNHHVF